MMFAYPREKTRHIWTEQLATIREAFPLFDGLKLLHIATDDTTAEDDIDQSGWDAVNIEANDPLNWELPGWAWAMYRLQDQSGFTVRLHSKGAVRGTAERHLDQWWRRAYETLLDVERVRESLRNAKVTGVFRRNQPTDLGTAWHYTGSMYAFRNALVFSGDWMPDEATKKSHYVEAWPALVASREEAGCLAWDNCGDLYQAKNWRSVPEKIPQKDSEVVGMIHRDVAPLSVVIISHNYGKYLAEAIASVRESLSVPAEIIVVDDASEDDTKAVAEQHGLKCVRHESRNVWESRRIGFENTTSKYICFLDADDKLTPGYLGKAVEQMEADGSIGIAYSDMREFGAGKAYRLHDVENLEWYNAIHAGSVVRRAALITSQAFASTLSGDQYHLDWALWKRVTRAGWKVAKNAEMYLYRRHADSMTANRERLPYYESAHLAHEIVTIVIPLSGRLGTMGRLSDWLESQTWPRRQCRLLLVDTVDDIRYAAQIAERLNGEYRSIRCDVLPVGRRGLADENRIKNAKAVQEAVAAMYAQLRMMVDTEYCLIVEDDVTPPHDAIERLLHGMDSRVAAVGGVGWSRYAHWYIAWDRERNHKYKTLGSGIEDIGGCWFGCTLIRRSCWLMAPITCDGRAGNYDFAVFDWLNERGWKCRINWDVHCRHGELLPTDKWRPQA